MKIIKQELEFGLYVNSWGKTSEKCFAPAFLMGLNKMHKRCLSKCYIHNTI